MIDNKQQVFSITICMNDFVLTVVVALPSWHLKFPNFMPTRCKLSFLIGHFEACHPDSKIEHTIAL